MKFLPLRPLRRCRAGHDALDESGSPGDIRQIGPARDRLLQLLVGASASRGQGAAAPAAEAPSGSRGDPNQPVTG